MRLRTLYPTEFLLNGAVDAGAQRRHHPTLALKKVDDYGIGQKLPFASQCD